MKKKPFIEHAGIKKLLDLHDGADYMFIKTYVINCETKSYTISKTTSQTKLLSDIMLQNRGSDYNMLVEKYHTSNMLYEKLGIRYGRGSDKIEKVKDSLRERKGPIKIVSIFSVDYWIKKGMTYDEARQRVSEIQSKNAHKHHAKKPEYKSMTPNSVNYWIKKGYSEIEAEELRRPYVNKSLQSKLKYIERYGHTLGLEKYEDVRNRRVITLLSKYGTTVTNGYVSKESLKFFVRLYKEIRKHGIERNDIYWGIGGSKEFAMHYNGKNYFYDFTIKSKKIIIEYNNTFWHPRLGTLWENQFVDEEYAKSKDETKKSIMENRGFNVIYVWNDDDFTTKIEEIINLL